MPGFLRAKRKEPIIRLSAPADSRDHLNQTVMHTGNEIVQIFVSFDFQSRHLPLKNCGRVTVFTQSITKRLSNFKQTMSKSGYPTTFAQNYFARRYEKYTSELIKIFLRSHTLIPHAVIGLFCPHIKRRRK